MAGDLLYVQEHLSCRHYVSDYRCSFRYREDSAGTVLTYENEPLHMFVFVLHGKMKIDCNEFRGMRYNAGQVAFIPKRAAVRCEVTEDSGAIFFMMDTVRNVCDKFNLHSYWPLCREITYDFEPVDIRPQLQTFLETMRYYLNEGINCEHYHEIKQQELFLVLRWFYPRKELAKLLYPIIGNSLDFKALVLENYLRVENVAQLAELSHMGRSKFDTVFKEEFGMPARQWMLRQIAKHVKHHLSEPGVTISDVMLKFNFNSPTHFTRFCKQQFDCTPTELMDKLVSL